MFSLPFTLHFTNTVFASAMSLYVFWELFVLIHVFIIDACILYVWWQIYSSEGALRTLGLYLLAFSLSATSSTLIYFLKPVSHVDDMFWHLTVTPLSVVNETIYTKLHAVSKAVG